MPTAQYSVEIAASMGDGAKTAAELDDLTEKLMGGGKGAEFFSEAMARTSDALMGARAAQAAANTALADGNKEFALLERAALQAAKAEEKAAQLGVVPPEVAQSRAAAAAALEAHTQKLRGLEQNAAKANAEEKQLAQTMANLKTISGHVDKSLAGNAERLSKLQGALGSVGGPLGALGQKVLGPVKGFSELSQSVGSANAAALLGVTGFVALAAAVVAVTVAVVAGAIAIAAWSVGLADVNRTARLATEAAEAMNPALVELRGAFESVDAATGLGSVKLRALTKDLQAAHVSAAEMPAALEAAALAEKALSDGGSKDFVNRIKAGKLAVGDFAADMRSKFGGIVQRQMLGLDEQTARLKKNIGSIFGDLDIEPALRGLETLVSLFDKNTAAGEAIKFLFEAVFQPLINSAEAAAYVVEAFVIGFLIGLTKVYIALKPAIKAVSEFFGFNDTSLTDVLDLAKGAGEAAAFVFVGFVAALVAVGAAIALVVGYVVATQVAFYAMIAAVGAAAAAIGVTLYNAASEAIGFLVSLPGRMVQIGADIMNGLAEGIGNAAGAVIGAITGAVGDAIDTAKKLLHINSPSKVFAAIGESTGEGFAMGIDDSTPEAQATLTDLVEPPKMAPTAAGSSTTTTTNNRGPLIVNINGADANVKQQLLELLEEWAGKGAGAPGAA